MKSANELKQLLYEIDRKGYPAYKGTKGSYRFSNYVLCIEHVQGDPFASPSKLHVQVSGSVAGYDKELFDLPHKKLALEDYLIRRFGKIFFSGKRIRKEWNDLCHEMRAGDFEEKCL